MIICVGKSRASKAWKKTELSWPEFAQRLYDAKQGEETMQEYLTLKKDEQLNLKDVGGFIPGELIGETRGKKDVKNICLLSLDIDFGDNELPNTVAKVLDGFQYLCHTTRKDRPEARRFRLMAPYSRPVDPVEGMAIMRRIAEKIGMKYFDKVSFQPNRLMFWPSISADQKLEVKEGQGKPIDADEVLATYGDFKNEIEWPRCPDEVAEPDRLIKNQADPLEKEGIIGDICRTYYPLSEYLEELLPGKYVQCDGYPNRYTWVEGTSAGGMLIYDDKFVFSHHESDPGYLSCLNAFDLIRVHNFKTTAAGKERDPEKAINETLKWFGKQPRIKDARQQSAKEEFSAVKEAAHDEDKKEAGRAKWQKRLDVDETGREEATLKNLLLYLMYEPALEGKLTYDEFSDQLEWEGRMFEETDFTRIRAILEGRGWTSPRYSQKTVVEGVNLYAKDFFRRNSLRDKLHSVEWDGKKRAETFFIDHLHIENNIYSREATFKWLLACYSRMRKPGAKFDNMIVLIDEQQGVGKSTILAKLALADCNDSRWFTDTLPGMSSRNRDNMMHIQGKFIAEIAELANMKNTEIEDTKAFITQRFDQFRGFGTALKVSVPRTCCFAGTSNRKDFLKDDANRRFWPLDCNGSAETGERIYAIEEQEVLQVWAEIRATYDSGAYELKLSKAAEAIAFEVQAAHEEIHEEYVLIAVKAAEFAKQPDLSPDDSDFVAGGEAKGFVSIVEIVDKCRLLLPQRLAGPKLRAYIGKALRSNGWQPVGNKRTKAYGVCACYKPKEDDILC